MPRPYRFERPAWPGDSGGDRDTFYLSHMLECITANSSPYCAAGNFESDEWTLDAVLRRLQILTELSKRISGELKAASPAVPGVSWRGSET